MIILGIESTCDETGATVVENGRKVLSNIVSSSVKLHNKYKGVVPEIAAREQVRVIIPVVNEALAKAFGSIRSNNSYKFGCHIDAIAVSYGAGLIGWLLVGVETAKTLALIWKKPLIPVNHLIGHIYANWIQEDIKNIKENKVIKVIKGNVAKYPYCPKYPQSPQFPLVALIVSGGHTDLLLMTDHGKYKWLGGTLDDAAGEAFDKVARILGLGYPGGPKVERIAQQWTMEDGQWTIKLPRPMIDSNNFDFSFSGLKTAIANLVHSSQFTGHSREEIAYEFQKAIADVLVTKTINAAKRFNVREILLGGGVAANSVLRQQLTDRCRELNISVKFPPVDLCIDNGAMIAAAAFFKRKIQSPQKLQADAGLYFAPTKV